MSHANEIKGEHSRLSPSKWKSRLEIVAYLSVIVVCAAILLEKGIDSVNGPRQPAQAPPTIARGDGFTALQALVPSEAEEAFVLVLSPTCTYCNASLPAFRRLVEARDSKSSPTAVVAAIHPTVPMEVEEAILEKGQVEVDEIRHLDSPSVGIRGLPTTLLIDRSGEVLGVWPGQMTDDRVQELIGKLR